MEFSNLIFGIDNLFKFLSLSGLVIVVFSIVYPMERQKEIDFNIIEYKKQKEIFEREVANLKIEMQELKKESLKTKTSISVLAQKKDSLLGIKSNALITLQIKNLDDKKNEITNDLKLKFGSIEKLTNEDAIKLIEINSAKDKIDKAEDYLCKYKFYSYTLLVIGFIMSIYGFIKWHFNQITSDKLQKVQLDIAEKELRS